MLNGRPIGGITLKSAALVAALAATIALAAAAEQANYPDRYPDLRGQWNGILRSAPGLPGQPSFDASKPWGKGQEAPLTAEYEAILDANLKAQAEGSVGDGGHNSGCYFPCWFRHFLSLANKFCPDSAAPSLA
jgi:hypothetical protein